MSAADAYLTELADRLLARGVDNHRVKDLLTELQDHLADSGESPQAAFGPCSSFADALLREELSTEGSASRTVERRTFRATAFDELGILSELGRDGWELTDVGLVGLHAQRARDPDAWRAWEYKRCTTLRPVVERMRADGWQPCGHWLAFHYFKRPVGSAP